MEPGQCYGFFGRNGSGKTTTIKCLLNLLRPRGGEIRVFGLNPSRHETEVKARLAYVPDFVMFYPWMRVRAEFAHPAPLESEFLDAKSVTRTERTLEMVVNGNGEGILERLRVRKPTSLQTESLTLEEIFLNTVR